MFSVELEAPTLRDTARRILEAEAARFGGPLGLAEVLRRRARGGPWAPRPTRSARTTLSLSSRAGALALVNRVELDGNLQRFSRRGRWREPGEVAGAPGSGERMPS